MGLRASAAHGAICRRNSGAGTARTNGLRAGRAPASGTGYLLPWPMSEGFARSSSTPPSFAPTGMLLVPQKNGPQAIGRSRGGLTTKIHVVVDAIGQLIQGLLTEGQVHDITQAPALLSGVPAKCVVADKAYDSQALRELIDSMGAKTVIPPRANRRDKIGWSKAIYRHRNLVERFFCRIKHYRRPRSSKTQTSRSNT